MLRTLIPTRRVSSSRVISSAAASAGWDACGDMGPFRVGGGVPGPYGGPGDRDHTAGQVDDVNSMSVTIAEQPRPRQSGHQEHGRAAAGIRVRRDPHPPWEGEGERLPPR